MSLVTSTSQASGDAIARHAAEASMAWHGWGSPVGLAILLVGLGVTGVLVRFAVFGL